MCDIIVDDVESYSLTMSDARDHVCQGNIPNLRPHSSAVVRTCNQLCCLKKNIRPFLENIDKASSLTQIRMDSMDQVVDTMQQTLFNYSTRNDYTLRYKPYT